MNHQPFVAPRCLNQASNSCLPRISSEMVPSPRGDGSWRMCWMPWPTEWMVEYKKWSIKSSRRLIFWRSERMSKGKPSDHRSVFSPQPVLFVFGIFLAGHQKSLPSTEVTTEDYSSQWLNASPCFAATKFFHLCPVWSGGGNNPQLLAVLPMMGQWYSNKCLQRFVTSLYQLILMILAIHLESFTFSP